MTFVRSTTIIDTIANARKSKKQGWINLMAKSAGANRRTDENKINPGIKITLIVVALLCVVMLAVIMGILYYYHDLGDSGVQAEGTLVDLCQQRNVHYI